MPSSLWKETLPLKQSLPHSLSASLYRFAYSVCSYKWSYKTWLFLSGFFHLVFSRFIHAACPSTSFLSKAEEHSTVCIHHIRLSSHLLMDMWIVSPFWLWWILYEHSCISFCFNTCFQFFWVSSQEWNSVFNLGTATLFPIVTQPFSVPTSSVFQVFHILANIYSS